MTEDRAKYQKHITHARDVTTAEQLNDEDFIEYISLLIFIGDDGRLWCKHGYRRVYYDRLNKYYDLDKKKWIEKR